MKSKSAKDAAIAAGYSPKYAAQSAHQALQGVRLRVPEILDKAGYSVHRWLRIAKTARLLHRGGVDRAGS
jgi:hypothetical protein